MAEPWIDMRDLVGPYKGQVRPYLKHAAEHAAVSGFAEYVRDEPAEVETRVAPAEVRTKPSPRASATPLPDGFPGKAALEEAGFGTVEAVRTLANPTGVQGVGAATAKKIARRLAELG